MTVTLVLPPTIADDISAASALPLESAAVLLARYAVVDGEVRLLARSIHWVDAKFYLERTSRHMLIASDGYVPALGLAEIDGAVPIWFHTHPGQDSAPQPSHHDQRVDEEISDLFRLRSGSPFYGALIASPYGQHFSFSGHIEDAAGVVSAIDRVWIVGERWRLLRSKALGEVTVDPMFDRNVRAFGPDVQGLLGSLRIGIVGAGGTGSAVAEQLVRLGVRHFLLIDPDHLSLSNVTRVYGSTPADVGREKVAVLHDHLDRIAPGLDCRTVTGMITLQPVAEELAGCDIVFGCSDDNAGRLILSRLSTFFLLPVIDVGVLLSSDASGTLSGIDGRITTLSPGNACLVCRNRIDMARAAAELRTPAERQRLTDEGYAPALGQTEPAVVAFTTAVAAAAVSELLDRLIGYGPPHLSSETLLRLHEREISTNHMAPRDTHYCHPLQRKWGAGMENPFLGQLWPQA